MTSAELIKTQPDSLSLKLSFYFPVLSMEFTHSLLVYLLTLPAMTLLMLFNFIGWILPWSSDIHFYFLWDNVKRVFHKLSILEEEFYSGLTRGLFLKHSFYIRLALLMTCYVVPFVKYKMGCNVFEVTSSEFGMYFVSQTNVTLLLLSRVQQKRIALQMAQNIPYKEWNLGHYYWK